jgi:hypothetical protein
MPDAGRTHGFVTGPWKVTFNGVGASPALRTFPARGAEDRTVDRGDAKGAMSPPVDPGTIVSTTDVSVSS